MAQTVIGVFEKVADANRAVQQLLEVGFQHADVDVSPNDRNRDISREEDRDKGIAGFFQALFSDADEQDRYRQATSRGTLVTVHTQTMEEAKRASAILDEYGSMDVKDASYSKDTAATAEHTEGSIPVIEEKLQVGKRSRESGQVRVCSRIVERPVEEHLRLKSEHVYVNRKPANRPASEDEIANFKEGCIEVTEHEEVPVVHKEAWVVEEVDVHTDVEEREEIVRDTVRQTEVEVDEHVSEEERRLRAEDDYDGDRR